MKTTVPTRVHPNPHCTMSRGLAFGSSLGISVAVSSSDTDSGIRRSPVSNALSPHTIDR